MQFYCATHWGGTHRGGLAGILCFDEKGVNNTLTCWEQTFMPSTQITLVGSTFPVAPVALTPAPKISFPGISCSERAELHNYWRPVSLSLTGENVINVYGAHQEHPQGTARSPHPSAERSRTKQDFGARSSLSLTLEFCFMLRHISCRPPS